MCEAMEIGIYLLTPTHVGTGQAAGAIDLPIARESHTGYPFLPATALKGVARDDFGRAVDRENGEDLVSRLFGSPPPQPGDDPGEKLHPGAVVFTDGHLLAYPVRSLTAPFYWVTCPSVIERWQRLRSAWRLDPVTVDSVSAPAATFTVDKPIVVQDHLIEPGEVRGGHAGLQAIARAWLRLIGLGDSRRDGESGIVPGFPGGVQRGQVLAKEFKKRLICLPDEDFGYLVQTTTPVAARVQLTPGKTTDTWKDESSGREYKGNLWYEETLPPECLFSTVVVSRRPGEKILHDLVRHYASGRTVQVGGNETVGQGLCWWVKEPSAGSSRKGGS